LSISGYGLQDVSLEEVFLKVTEQFKKSPNAAAIEAEFNHPIETAASTPETSSAP
jgi:hypothetical protein